MALDQISLDELLEQINTHNTDTISSLSTEPIAPLTWTYNNSTSDPAYGAVPTYSINSGGTSATGVWTTTGTNTMPNVTISAPTWTTANPYTVMGAGTTTVDHGGTISLKGEKADVDINGKSLRAWMEQVEERLNILTPNPELEKEWDDLRRLGERYRKLEKKCKEKAEVWKRLKQMPKVDIK